MIPAVRGQRTGRFVSKQTETYCLSGMRSAYKNCEL
jgi:hypothetical protein